MEPVTTIMAVVAAVGNVVLGFISLFQRAKKRKALEQLDTVTDGLRIIEAAIDENKGLAESTDVGRKITSTIKAYGSAVELAVDRARELAGQLRKP